MFPHIAAEDKPAGYYGNIPVAVAVGDNQASFCGSVKDSDSMVLVNVGTGGQVSLYTGSGTAEEDIELRPYISDGYLMAGCALCSGRAYAALKGFFEAAAQMLGVNEMNELYDVMDDYLDAHPVTKENWQVETTFDGTRSHPQKRAAMTGISLETFKPQYMIEGVLRGIAQELYGFYRQMTTISGKTPKAIVGAGNGIRKNRHLRRCLTEVFGMPVIIPAHAEEAAYGAALTAMYSAGIYPSLKEAQQLIKYEQ